MTPFQEFRLWVRRAPIGERVSAAAATFVAIGLLAWVLVPAGRTTSGSVDLAASPTGGAIVGDARGRAPANTVGPSAATRSSGSPAETAPGPVGRPDEATGPGAPTPGAPGLSSPVGSLAPAHGVPAIGAGGGPATGAGCSPPPGADQGVSASEIKVAITLVNIIGPAGNSTFGVPPASEQQTDYQEDIDALNAAGGVACCHLVAQFYSANPADQSDLQQKCLDIAQTKPFAVIDTGAYTGSPSIFCYAQHQLPLIAGGFLPAAQFDRYYPYLFGAGTWETLYRNAVLALQARGFFSASNGFKKLGYIYGSCFPEIKPEFMGWLQQAGVPASQVVSYDVGCPSGFASPSDIQQAILKFEQNGVTHMTESLFYTNFASFTKIAQQQGFKPKYGIADDGIVAITGGNLSPDYSNIANAVAITSDRWAEPSTPGMAPTAGTARCNAIYAGHHRPPVYQQAVGLGGVTCDLVWKFAAAIDHATGLQRTSLAAGLLAAKSVDFSYPSGPADWVGPRVTYDGQYWRPLQFVPSCRCWRVIDPTFRPSFG